MSRGELPPPISTSKDLDRERRKMKSCYDNLKHGDLLVLKLNQYDSLCEENENTSDEVIYKVLYRVREIFILTNENYGTNCRIGLSLREFKMSVVRVLKN